MNKLTSTIIKILAILFVLFIFVNYLFGLYKNYENRNSKEIVLTFDDAWESQYKAFKMIKPYKGTLYINSNFVGKEERLTVSQIREAYECGWDVSNHTYSHKNLLNVDIKNVEKEILSCQKWLEKNGFTRNNCHMHFAYPEGSYNSKIISELGKLGILTARTTNPGNSIDKPLEIGRTSLHGMTKKNIRDKIMSDEKLIILSFHRIVPDDSKEIKDIDIKESYYIEVLKAIKKSKRKVITMTELYNRRIK